MVNQDPVLDPTKALECKEKGNKCFQNSDWTGAESWYTQAIQHDPTNPLLYTNLSMSLLKLQQYPRVITTSQTAISLSSANSHLHGSNMKAYFQLAQAQIALHLSSEALSSAKEAHRLCVEEIHDGGKGASSIGPITELVLRCKGEDWERREKERMEREKGLLWDVLKGLEARRDGEVMVAIERGEEKSQVEARERTWERKINDAKRIFDRTGEGKRRKVPDWCVDDITFGVMVDPVVTKTGQSYDRSSIMEHLKRSATDPLTREPLRPEDLRPNLALRAACEEFLEENGWAVDW